MTISFRSPRTGYFCVTRMEMLRNAAGLVRWADGWNSGAQSWWSPLRGRSRRFTMWSPLRRAA